jgi:hypothetical protein
MGFNNSNSDIFFEILFVMVSVYSLWVAYRYISDRWYKNQSKEWKSVRGEIISCSYGPIIKSVSLFTTKGGYRIKVRYKYKIEGKEFIGSKLSFNNSVYPTAEIAERLCESYNSGDEVTVYYSPYSYQKSVLIRD